MRQKHSPSSAGGERDEGRESLSSYFLPQMMSHKGKTQPSGWCGYVLSSPGTSAVTFCKEQDGEEREKKGENPRGRHSRTL